MRIIVEISRSFNSESTKHDVRKAREISRGEVKALRRPRALALGPAVNKIDCYAPVTLRRSGRRLKFSTHIHERSNRISGPKCTRSPPPRVCRRGSVVNRNSLESKRWTSRKREKCDGYSKYHVIFVPKSRRNVFCRDLGKVVRDVFRQVKARKEATGESAIRLSKLLGARIFREYRPGKRARDPRLHREPSDGRATVEASQLWAMIVTFGRRHFHNAA